MAKSKRAARALQIAVVGGGWAGCAAAVELARAGHGVTLFEASRTLGGRARRVALDAGVLDNGQHILLGAYSETLRLLKLVGVEPRRALLNLPLQMRYPPGSGGMDFVAPRWPAPLHLAAALLRAKGLARADKLALARFSSTARWMGWQLHQDCSVSELLERYDQTARLNQLMWRPLCLAALNTPPERASAQVFLSVLRDSLGAKRAASDMLLPKVDLSALFPDAAAAFAVRHGASVLTGATVTGLRQLDGGRWQVEARGEAAGGAFDGVVLASPAAHAAQVLENLQDPATSSIATQLQAFETEAISTCYLQYAPGLRLEQAFFALVDAPAAGHWGQFVFDRGQLDATQPGLLAVVVSASGAAAAQGQTALAEAIARQLAEVFRRPELASPAWSRLITDKRATFACTPGLSRPGNATGLPGLTLAGDYTASDYPATIEAAVRSGVLAAADYGAAP
ncbi:hydroxysqualene dehydroxylase HpnE [Janthinobacterium fluminis]|uniref:Hydroxysqualene dehydroxylase HpnE n=1 Tax=Janthinobacterium fluminis TaxID=2987524 RepID=A0ABT5JX22_9BURK|nr:hydroxysqualene dehydroxylase HpnE [Janthinobacterium fluminis]MDC8756715.1 hydroxysqualene dehydroxylase HpnE [Janthinobacterium fluminis]